MASGTNLKTQVRFLQRAASQYKMFLRKLFIYLKYTLIITFFLSSHIKAGIDNCDMFIQSIEVKKNLIIQLKPSTTLVFFQKN